MESSTTPATTPGQPAKAPDDFSWGDVFVRNSDDVHDRQFPEYPTKEALAEDVAQLQPGDQVTAELDNISFGPHMITGRVDRGSERQTLFVAGRLLRDAWGNPANSLVRVERHTGGDPA